MISVYKFNLKYNNAKDTKISIFVYALMKLSSVYELHTFGHSISNTLLNVIIIITLI